MMKHIVIAAVACFLALLPAACKKAEKNVNQREMGQSPSMLLRRTPF